MKLLKLFAPLFLIFYAFSCTDQPLNSTYNNDIKEVMENSPFELSEPHFTTSFDWENEEFFSFRDGNNNIISVRPPWHSSAQSVNPTEIREDHKHADGWRLVYNMFDPTIPVTTPHPKFVLYNQYRGTLRFFYYRPNETLQGSNFVSNALIFDGSPTSTLNFSYDFARELNEKGNYPFEIKNNAGAFNNGMAGGHWYSFDHEIAYDPDISSIPSNQLYMTIKAWTTETSFLDLEGSLEGTIEGFIQANGAGGSSLFNNLIADFSTDYTGVDKSVTVTTGSKTDNTLKDTINKAIDNALGNAIESSLQSLASGAINWATSPLLNLFNSSVSTSVNNNQAVNLDLSAKLKMEGSLTSSSLVYSTNFIMPGTQRDGIAGGLYPYEDTDYPLGLFNINDVPIVEEEITIEEIADEYGRPTDFNTISYFELDEDSFDIVFNPNLLDVATVSDVRKDLIWLAQYQGGSNEKNESNRQSSCHNTLINITAGNEWYITAPNNTCLTKWYGARSFNGVSTNLAVRVSFTVNPNSSAEPVFVSKTFRPTFDKTIQ